MQFYNEYVVIKRFKGKTVSGMLNLPYGTVYYAADCGNNQRAIVCDKGIICNVISDAAFQFFTQNDDGNGLERGRLTQASNAKSMIHLIRTGGTKFRVILYVKNTKMLISPITGFGIMIFITHLYSIFSTLQNW